MAYDETVWTNDGGEAINATNLNNIEAGINALDSNSTTHRTDMNNPHGTTKIHVGLTNVDDTSDVNKPISSATGTALGSKEDGLGNPSMNGYVLSSTVAGVRTWVNTSAIGDVSSVNGLSGAVTIGTDQVNEGSTNLYHTDARVDARIVVNIDDTTSSSTTLYSSTKIDSIVAGSLHYLGTWNATTNTPSLSDATGSNGDYYKVAVAGNINLGSSVINFSEGDDVIHNGSIYEKVTNIDAISSVNGEAGVVVLTTDNIVEGTGNLYSTNARIDGRLSNVINDGISASGLTWSSVKISDYVNVATSAITYPVTSVATKTGAVVLDGVDVGLGNVDNTSDLNKPLSTLTIGELVKYGKLDTVNTYTARQVGPNASLDGDYVNTTSYASSTLGGTLKARLDGAILYLTTDGTDA